jgi:hypothetical protein
MIIAHNPITVEPRGQHNNMLNREWPAPYTAGSSWHRVQAYVPSTKLRPCNQNSFFLWHTGRTVPVILDLSLLKGYSLTVSQRHLLCLLSRNSLNSEPCNLVNRSSVLRHCLSYDVFSSTSTESGSWVLDIRRKYVESWFGWVPHFTCMNS